MPSRSPPRPSPARRAVVVPLVICLALVTALALVGAGLTLATPGGAAPPSGSAAAHEDVVRDFYAAINQAIQTGEAAGVDRLVAPAVRWCSRCPDQTPSSTGLQSYLRTLHDQTPAARLVVETVVANAADTVMAQITVTGFPVIRSSVLWGPVDTFHLVDERISERQSLVEATAEIDPLLRVELPPLPPAVTGVVLARLTFPTNTRAPNGLSAGPTLVVIEAGALAVRIARGGRIWRDGAGDPAWSIPQTGTTLATVLRQGDAVLIPAGVRYDLTQQGTDHAVALGLTLISINGRGGARESVPFLPVDEAGQEMHPLALPTVHVLISGRVDAWPTGPVTVALGRAILRPGAQVVPAANDVVLLAVEAGRVSTIDKEIDLLAGEGLMRAQGPDGAVHNGSAGVAILVLVTVAPVPG